MCQALFRVNYYFMNVFKYKMLSNPNIVLGLDNKSKVRVKIFYGKMDALPAPGRNTLKYIKAYVELYAVYRRAGDEGADVVDGDVHQADTGFLSSPRNVRGYEAILGRQQGIVGFRRFR